MGFQFNFSNPLYNSRGRKLIYEQENVTLDSILYISPQNVMDKYSMYVEYDVEYQLTI